MYAQENMEYVPSLVLSAGSDIHGGSWNVSHWIRVGDYCTIVHGARPASAKINPAHVNQQD